MESSQIANNLHWEFNIQNKDFFFLKRFFRDWRKKWVSQPAFWVQLSLNNLSPEFFTYWTCMLVRAGLWPLLISERHLSQTNRARQTVPFEVCGNSLAHGGLMVFDAEVCWPEETVLKMWRFSAFLRRCTTTSSSRHYKKGKVAQTTSLLSGICIQSNHCIIV